MLAQRGAAVVVECAPSLVPCWRRMPGVAQACARGRRPAYDVWVDQMSLPRLFGTTLGHRALSPPPTSARMPGGHARWDRTAAGGLRVGLAWAGNPLHSNDARRSMPVAALAPIVCRRPGCTGSSACRWARGAQDAAGLPGVADYADALTDWRETAAAIGRWTWSSPSTRRWPTWPGRWARPTWVMLPHAPDWRWMLGRADSPWYSCMRLFRQDSGRGTGTGVAQPASPPPWRSVVRPAYAADYSMAMPPLTCSVAPVTQAASSEAR